MDTTHYALFEEFFRRFHFAIKSTSLYSPGHPSFKKTVESFQESIEQLKPSFHTLYFAAIPTGIVLNDELLTAEQSPLFVEIASFLHARTIESIEIVLINVTPEELEEFIALVSQKNTDELRKSLGQKQFNAIKINLLDFSEILKKEPETAPAAAEKTWEERLTQLFIEKRAGDFRSALENLLAIPQETGQQPEIENALIALEKLFTEQGKNTPFLNELIKVAEQAGGNPAAGANEAVLGTFYTIISQNAAPEALAGLISTLASLYSKADKRLFNAISERVGERKQEEIVKASTNIFKLQGILLKNEGVVDSLHQLVLDNPLNKFAGMMYQYTLKYFTQLKQEERFQYLKEFNRSLNPQALQADYIGILYELLKCADPGGETPESNGNVLAELARIFQEYTARKDIEAAFFMLGRLQKETPDFTGCAEFQEALRRFLDDNFDLLLSSERIETLKAHKELLAAVIESALPQKIPLIAERYCSETDASRKSTLEGILMFFKNEPALAQLAAIGRSNNVQKTLEMIHLLALINRPACAEFLIVLYQSNTTAMARLAVLKEMHKSPVLRSKKFLLSILEQYREPSLARTEIISALLEEQDGFINNRIASFLLERIPQGSVILNKPEFIETLSFIREIRLKESVFFLREIMQKNAFWLLFFPKSRKDMMETIVELTR